MTNLLLVMLGWFTGGFINGLAGFGAAMIAMPLIASFIDFSLAVPSCVLIVLTLNCQVGWDFRHDIEFRYIKGILIGALPGVVLSAIFLPFIPENGLKGGMGIFIACYALYSLFFEKSKPGEHIIHPVWGYVTGILSSSLGMAFGFNGPPLAAYVAYCGCNARAVKGILGAGFIVTGFFIVTAKASAGLMTADVIKIWALSSPAVIAGSKLGILLSSRLSEQKFRILLFIALTAMGIRIAWSALL
jgi:uncharacterized membrane protein YfcA